MPRVRRKAKRRNDYTSQEIKLLTTGVSLTTRFGAVHKGTGDMVALREAWGDLRDELMDQWIAEYPFSRPFAWLLFDATEPRQRTTGEQLMESMELVKSRGLYGGDYRLCYFENLNVRLGAEETRYGEGNWETEKQYLCRLNLLTESERALL
jgi:hypothetical protein